jgi:hypothetical protein
VQVLLDHAGPAAAASAIPPLITVSAVIERPGYAVVNVQTVDRSGRGGVATVALTYWDAGAFLSSTCGDGQVACVAAGSSYTFTVAGARGTARYIASAIDAAGNAAVTPTLTLTVDDSPAPSGPITLAASADRMPGWATVRATAASTAGDVSSATLYWTDTRGITMSRPLCRTGSAEWSLPVELAQARGARSYAVVATDERGNASYSMPTEMAVVE